MLVRLLDAGLHRALQQDRHGPAVSSLLVKHTCGSSKLPSVSLHSCSVLQIFQREFLQLPCTAQRPPPVPNGPNSSTSLRFRSYTEQLGEVCRCHLSESRVSVLFQLQHSPYKPTTAQLYMQYFRAALSAFSSRVPPNAAVELLSGCRLDQTVCSAVRPHPPVSRALCLQCQALSTFSIDLRRAGIGMAVDLTMDGAKL